MIVLEGEKKPESKAVEPVMEKETIDDNNMVFLYRCFDSYSIEMYQSQAGASYFIMIF